METEDWRAVAVGYGAGVLMAFIAGFTWMVPVAAIVAALACRSLWRS
jgi:hypothetical protein